MEMKIAIAVIVLLTIAYAVSSVRASAAMRKAKKERNDLYRNCFLKGLAGILAKMAKADGSVSKDEAGVVSKLFRDMGLSEEDRKLCSEAFATAKDSSLPASYYASLFAPYSTLESKVLVYEVLWDVAAADRRFAEDEEKFLQGLLSWLNLDQSHFDTNLRSHARKFDKVDEALSEVGKKIDSILKTNFN